MDFVGLAQNGKIAAHAQRVVRLKDGLIESDRRRVPS